MMDPRDYIDWDEAREFLAPFYATAEPCESCGAPTFEGRVWNIEHQIWIAQDCGCSAPSMPTCPDLIPLLAHVDSVREVCQVIRSHRAKCPLCGPVKIPVKRAPGVVPIVVKEAA